MMRLELLAPLFYTKFPEDITRRHGEYGGIENEEILFCFEINPKQGCDIEPDHKQFLGNLLFAGHKDNTSNPLSTSVPAEPLCEINRNDAENVVVLPAGCYLFLQHRGDMALNQGEWLDMAIEQQKDGLWERHKLGNLLYLRYLHEDGAVVTQVFRLLA
jgi:hypothetical protein